MLEKLKSWRVQYLADRAVTGRAVADKSALGWYRNEDVVMAASREEVVKDFCLKGFHVISVKERARRHPLLDRVTPEYKQRFLLSLLFNVEGGASPGRALEMLIEQETGAMRARLNVGLLLLRQGRSFVDSMRALDLFDEATLAIVDAGEATGKLPTAIRAATEHIEKAGGVGKVLKAALVGASIELVIGLVSVVGVRYGMIPDLRQQGPAGHTPDVIERFNRGLDNATIASDVVIYLSMLIIVVGVVLVAGYFGRDESLRRRIDLGLLRVPVLKTLLTDGALGASAAVIRSLLQGGVMVLPACRIVARGVSVPNVKAYWQGSQERIEMGEPIGRALSNDPLSASEQIFVQNHRDVAQLSETFGVIAEQRSSTAKAAAKRLGKFMLMFLVASQLACAGVVAYVVYVQNAGLEVKSNPND